MRLKILWPGKTRNKAFLALQEDYLARIRRIEPCEIIETREARGISEKDPGRILGIEAKGLEKHLEDDYIICLFHEGKEMSSEDFARFLERRALESARPTTFVVGSFLGLAPRILGKAHVLLSLSRMTFSHELARVALLEQIYRSLSIMKGKRYAR